jgi:hypothetical protein
MPSVATSPSPIANFVITTFFETVMFSFDALNDIDLDSYAYRLYDNALGTGTPVAQGRNKANVFTVSVQNTTDSTPRRYWGQVAAVNSAGVVATYTPLQSDQATPQIGSQYIATLTADKIRAGTIGAHTITLGGNSSVIKSSTYDGTFDVPTNRWTTGGAGWLIAGNGQAIFDATQIRGSISAGSINLNTHNYWLPSGSTATFKVGTASKYMNFDGTNITFTGDLSAVGGTFTGRLEVGGVDIGNDVGPGTGHYGISLSTTDFNNIFLRRNDGVYFFRVGNGGANSITWDSSSNVLNVTGTISASAGNIGNYSISGGSLTASGSGSFGLFVNWSSNITLNTSAAIGTNTYYSDSLNDLGFHNVITFNDITAPEGGVKVERGSYNAAFTVYYGGAGYRYSALGPQSISDERLKNILNKEANALNILNQIQIVPFTYKDDFFNSERLGFIAQQLHTVLPNMVVVGSENAEERPWTVVMDQIVPYLTKAIQQLSQKVEELESRLV